MDNGAFRDFRYQSLAGTAGFAGRQLSLDVRLQQSPQTWLVARGTPSVEVQTITVQLTDRGFRVPLPEMQPGRPHHNRFC